MNSKRGFTLVELLVTIPTVVMITAVVISLLMNLYGNLLTKNGLLEMEVDAQSALFTIRDDPFFAVHFAGTNQDGTTDTYAPTGGWNAVNDNAFIIYEASFNANRQTATRQLIYKQDEPHACNAPEINENQFSTNTLIYFVSGGTLYRRVLIPNQSLNCLTTFRKQTCPLANSSAACPADVVITRNVQSFTATYYDRQGTLISASSLESNPDLFLQAQRADLLLNLQKNINGEPANVSASISIKKTE